MFGIVFMLLILDGFLLGVIVLLQSGKGDGLAAMGGSGGTLADSILGGRQAATLLTRATWTTGGIFLFLALVLSVMSSRARQPQSVLQQEFSVPAAPQPLLPGTDANPAGSQGGNTQSTNPATGTTTTGQQTGR